MAATLLAGLLLGALAGLAIVAGIWACSKTFEFLGGDDE